MADNERSQREEAVRRVLSGEPASSVGKRIDRSERWVRKWVARYDPDNADWSRSVDRTPHTSPTQTTAEVEELVVNVRKRLAANPWAQTGAVSIAWELTKLGIDQIPSIRTIERILARNNVPRRPARPKGYVPKGTTYPSVAATLANGCHQLDLVGPRYLTGGDRFYAVNAIDIARRKVAGEITTSRDAETICDAVIAIWQRLGVPQRLQIDNQQALAGARGRPGALVRLCLNHGVIPTFIPFGEPWRNGIIEHFNDTFDKKFYRTEAFDSINHVAERYKAFEAFHNATHRYSALHGATPNQTEQRLEFTPTPPPHRDIATSFDDLTGTVEWIRLIRSDHQITILDRKYPTPPELTHEYVTARLTIEDQQLAIYHHAKHISTHPFPLT